MAKAVKLTKTAVEGLQASDKRFAVWDVALKGFGVRVAPTGRKTYVLQYDQPVGDTWVTRQITLGMHGKITAEQARNLAEKATGKLADGVDVAADKRRAKIATIEAPTIEKLANEWLERHVREKLKPKTVAVYEQILLGKVVPALGPILARDLTRDHIGKLHHSLKDTKRQANHAVAITSSMMNWAIDHDYRPDRQNPCDRVKMFPLKKKQRFLSEPELGRLGAAIKLAETEGVPWEFDADAPSKHWPKDVASQRSKLCPWAAGAIRLLLFTGCRKDEILTLRWEHVDFDDKVLRILDHKTDGVTGEKRVMLIPPALQVLADIPRIKDNPFVIAGKLPGAHRADLKRPFEAVLQLAKLEGVRLHDLRHTLASHGQAAGLSLELVGGLLGHRNIQTTQRYAHLWDAPKRAASERVGARMASAFNGETLPTAEVVKLPVKRS
jgi:integrase